jgi:DNA-binding LacI/PurR family transcriptional regulator
MTDRNDHAVPGRPRVTLKHVAEACGLGVTTVSDILNCREGERSRYSRPTQEKVHRVVAEMGYAVDRAAQQLRRGRSGTIGLLLTRQQHEASFAHTLGWAEDELRVRGFKLMLANGHGPTVEAQLAHLREGRVEGIIFGPAYDADELAPLDVMDVPAVVFGGWCGGRYDEAYVDQATARQLAVDHLRNAGHGRIATFEPDDAGMGGDDAGWRVTADAREPESVFATAMTFARRWVAAEPGHRPTALLCHDDHTAAIALAALWQAGVRVPEDLSVVGCGDTAAAPYLVPPLTTVDLRSQQQMVMAIGLLVHRLSNPDDPAATRRIEPQLVVRGSTASI